MARRKKQAVTPRKSAAATTHPDYDKRLPEWVKVRDCMKGEKAIKDKREEYLPRPKGMSGEYAEAYDAYLERAHFPLIVPYALSGALGVIITKMPEFNIPKHLDYIVKEATNDGRSLNQLLMDVIIEIFQTGRVPLAVDVTSDNKFKFVQNKAEKFINWKTSTQDSVKSLIAAVFKEEQPANDEDIFSHEVEDRYKALLLKNGVYIVEEYNDKGNLDDKTVVPEYMGRTLDEIPVIVAGSINNSVEIQPIPLVSVANCSVQIFRKEADLANSEFLSCNPTLVVVGADSEDDIPNVVGSSVMMIIPNDQARVFYTETDTAALQHVSSHIKDLYEEAIRHGVAILDARKGVEAAEALRIRQATQSASVYSIYLSALTAILSGLKLMCKWSNHNPDEVTADAPSSLTYGTPDSAVIRELVDGFSESGVVPINVIYRYLVSAGLLEQTVGYEDYLVLIEENVELRDKLGLGTKQITDGSTEGAEFDTSATPEDDEAKRKARRKSKAEPVKRKPKRIKKPVNKELEGQEDKTT